MHLLNQNHIKVTINQSIRNCIKSQLIENLENLKILLMM
jgi:hypothetical protein